jgi:hypothetical protein
VATAFARGAAAHGSFREGAITANRRDRRSRDPAWHSPSRLGVVRGAHESGRIFRGKLHAQGRAKFIDTEAAQVLIEIAERRRQPERLDAG